jgi:hypothetical protein
MLRLIRKIIAIAICGLMTIISIPNLYEKGLEISKLNENSNEIVKHIIEFFKVYDKYKSSDFMNYWYIGVGIICLSLFLEIISIFTRKHHILNFIIFIVFIAAIAAFNGIYFFAYFKMGH